MKGVHVTAVICELSIRKRVGPFNLEEGEDQSRTLLLRIPEDTEPGTYDIRITFNNAKVRRVKHRPVIII